MKDPLHEATKIAKKNLSILLRDKEEAMSKRLTREQLEILSKRAHSQEERDACTEAIKLMDELDEERRANAALSSKILALEAEVERLRMRVTDLTNACDAYAYGMESRRLAMLQDTEREVHFEELRAKLDEARADAQRRMRFLGDAQAEAQRMRAVADQVRAERDELRTEVERLRPRQPGPGETHWEECWRNAGHHQCAVNEVERLKSSIRWALGYDECELTERKLAAERVKP